MRPTDAVLWRFGLGAPTGEAVEAARGAMGRVYRVETATGVWAVKELFEHEHKSVDAYAHERDHAAELERQAAFVEAAREGGVAARNGVGPRGVVPRECGRIGGVR